MVVSDRTDALPLWLLVATIVLSLVRLTVALNEKFNPPNIPQRIAWSTYKDSKAEIFKKMKPAALLFVHERKCLECGKLETSLQQPEVAEDLSKNYIPIKVLIPRRKSQSDKLPEEIEALKENYAAWSIPDLILIPPSMWEVTVDSDRYSLPDLGYPPFRGEDSTSIRSLLKRGVDFQPEVLTYGDVNWVKPEIALKEATDDKPALLYFGRSLDRHSDYVRSKIFGDTQINKIVKENFLPTFIVSHERKGIANSAETKALLARFRVKSYPTIVVSSPSRPAQVITGFAGTKETIEFLSQARGK